LCGVLRQRVRSALHDADLIISFAFFILVAARALRLAPELFTWDPSVRVTSPSAWPVSQESEELLYLYIGKQLHHLPIMFAAADSWKDRPAVAQTILMFAHHVLSVAGYLRVLVNGHLMLYAVSAMITEGSTPFLIIMSMMTKTGLKNSRVGGVLFLLNGIFLWLAYIFFRLLLFPPIFYFYISDWDLIMQRAGKVDGISSALVLAFLWVLSMWWFSKINAGLMKALKSALSGQKKKDA